MKTKSNVILYIAASLDGFIAGENDDLSFLKRVEKDGEDYGYKEFIDTIDVVITGKITYEWVLKNVHEDYYFQKETYVITHQPLQEKRNVKFYSGDLSKLITKLKDTEHKRIFIEGGTEIIHQLMLENLIDEYYISYIPVILGNGKRLFKEGIPTQNLKLISSTKFDTGLVQLHLISETES